MKTDRWMPKSLGYSTFDEAAQVATTGDNRVHIEMKNLVRVANVCSFTDSSDPPFFIYVHCYKMIETYLLSPLFQPVLPQIEADNDCG